MLGWFGSETHGHRLPKSHPTTEWHCPTHNWPATSHRDSTPPQARSSYVRVTPWAAFLRLHPRWSPAYRYPCWPAGTIGTPGYVVRRDSVTLHDTHTLATRHIPHAQGPIFTATKQAVAIKERNAMHNRSMPMQRRSIASLFDVPEPDCIVKATTGHSAPIGTPGHAIHPVRMPRSVWHRRPLATSHI